MANIYKCQLISTRLFKICTYVRICLCYKNTFQLQISDIIMTTCSIGSPVSSDSFLFMSFSQLLKSFMYEWRSWALSLICFCNSTAFSIVEIGNQKQIKENNIIWIAKEKISSNYGLSNKFTLSLPTSVVSVISKINSSYLQQIWWVSTWTLNK